MTSQTNPYQPAIDELEKELADVERNANSLRTTINVLRGKAGLPPLPGGGGGIGFEPVGVSSPTPSTIGQIRPDTFYGKKMGTAAREYLEMRRAQNLGPAKPRDVYEAMVNGGFQFETKDENVAMVSLRAMLRKNTVMFHKLPNGSYGLRSWYPNGPVTHWMSCPAAPTPSTASGPRND